MCGRTKPSDVEEDAGEAVAAEVVSAGGSVGSSGDGMGGGDDVARGALTGGGRSDDGSGSGGKGGGYNCMTTDIVGASTSTGSQGRNAVGDPHGRASGGCLVPSSMSSHSRWGWDSIVAS